MTLWVERRGDRRARRSMLQEEFASARGVADGEHDMRYLAIDLGDKRTGLAAGDAITGVVMPLSVLEVPISERGGAALLEAIAQAVDEHFGPASPGELVMGLPMNMDDSEGPRAKLVRAWGERVRERCGRVVHFHDERLSSADADWTMAGSGLTHKQKKQRRDALAAAAILRGFLAIDLSGGEEHSRHG